MFRAKNMQVLLEAKFQLFGVLKKEDGWYIAHCPPLDIYNSRQNRIRS